jgi:hypothetical protein
VSEMQNSPEKHGNNSPRVMEGPRIISYNLNESQRPDGLKVRYKVRIETGRKAAALNADPAAYPSPDGTGWTQTTVTGILRNPKYTGYMVFGRKRTINGKKRPVPPADWLWSPQPSHPALIDRAT